MNKKGSAWNSLDWEKILIGLFLGSVFVLMLIVLISHSMDIPSKQDLDMCLEYDTCQHCYDRFSNDMNYRELESILKQEKQCKSKILVFSGGKTK